MRVFDTVDRRGRPVPVPDTARVSAAKATERVRPMQAAEGRLLLSGPSPSTADSELGLYKRLTA